MNFLDQIRIDTWRASGGSDVEIPTLELTCSEWAEPLFVCSGFEDITATDENGRTITFIASGMDVALPKKNNQGGQVLGIAIDNVRGDAQARIDAAKSADADVFVTYRLFLYSDLSAPAERPYTMNAKSVTMVGPKVEIQCGYFDMINSAWPRDRYDSTFSPGIKYLA